MKNLKIGHRLALSFGAVVVILIVLATLAYTRFKLLDEDISIINDNRYPKVVMAHEAKDALNITARAMRNTLLMSDPAEIKGELALIGKEVEKSSRLIDELDKVVAAPQGRVFINELLAARTRFLAAQDNFVTLINQGQRDAAQVLMYAELRPLQLTYMENLDQLVSFQAGLMKEAGDSAHTAVAT